MNFVESNGSKVAAVLCVASCFPVVATIYAMETQVGSNNDVNTNVAKADANAWQEITGTSPVIDESKSNVAKVAVALSDDVNENVAKASQEYIKETTQVEETVATPEEMEEVLFAEPVSVEAESTPAVVEEFVEPQEAVVTEEAVEEVAESEYVEEAAADYEVVEAVADVETVEEPAVEESYVEEAPAEEAYVEEETAVEEVSYEETYVEPEVAEDPVYEESVVTSTSTGQDIANAALSLVGTTNGWQCTEVASYALSLAGVEGVPVCWPDQYQYYGTVSYEAVVGSLAYYDNGGRGVDHIAVYIGDGQCVHGNFDGQTIVYSETTASGSPDYYVVFE